MHEDPIAPIVAWQRKRDAFRTRSPYNRRVTVTFAAPPIGYSLDGSFISRSPQGKKALQDALGEWV